MPLTVLLRTYASACMGMAFLLGAVSAQAAVDSVEIHQREPVLNGQPFGETGPYEQLSGLIHFAFDPAAPANAAVVDIAHAPRDTKGRVRATADFVLLRPLEAPDTPRVGLLEISNRGGKASLRYFNAATRRALDPQAPAAFGDGLLMRMGLTIMWVGWQFDVPPAPGRVRLQVPVARLDTGRITGQVRSDWVVDEATRVLALAHREHWAYPVSDPSSRAAVLTRRRTREGVREGVPSRLWSFANEMDGRAVADLTHLHAPRGFAPGYIYEMVYPASDPRVVGLGLAAMRDVAAYAKHNGADGPFGVKHMIGFGVSQTGRFLRQFLYQGFNADESGRRAFDGLLIHTAGAGRGSFNHRFAQPSRDGHRYAAFFYPTDLFPFTSAAQRDPLCEEGCAEDGLLSIYQAPALLPRMMVTNTGYEYWGRAASLIHTTTDGEGDMAPMPNERLYAFSSSQHFVGRWPPAADRRLPGADVWRGNPVDFLVNLRALLNRLVQWVALDRAPPPSRYPSLKAGTLQAVDALQMPDVAGLTPPAFAHEAYRADYGPQWRKGIVHKQPPHLGPAFVSRVASVDGVGNELGGVRNVEVQVPVATYTPWSLRDGLPNASEMADFRGLFAPLPLDAANAKAVADPRPHLRELYPTRADYLQKVSGAIDDLIAEGFLLQEDAPRVRARALDLWHFANATQARAGRVNERD